MDIIGVSKYVRLLMALVCLLSVFIPVSSASATLFPDSSLIECVQSPSPSYPLSPQDMPIVKALEYLRGVQKADGSIAGFNVAGWVVMAIVAAGEDPHGWNKGGDSIIDYLKKKTSANFPSDKATDYERMLMAIVAANENPRNFGGLDYVDALSKFYDGTQIGFANTLNDDSWGILALTAIGANPEIIQNVKNYLITKQNVDGGWGLTVGGTSDADNTGAAISALVAAGEPINSQIITNGLNYLKTQQQINGGFASIWGGSNTGSTTWAINAIRAVGQNPAGEEWSKNGNTPISYLLSQQGADGAFLWTPGQKSNPEWMTAYAIVSLLGKPYPRDTTPPVISSLVPPHNTTPASSSPVVSAAFSDAVSGIDRTRVQILLNDNVVTLDAVVGDSGISYNAIGLGAGTHRVTVVVADKCGNEALQEWSFDVVAGDGGGGWLTSGASQQLPPGTTSVPGGVQGGGIFDKETLAVSEDKKCQIVIGKDTRGKAESGEPLSKITIMLAGSSPQPPQDSRIIGRVYDVGPGGAVFDKPVAITLTYNDLLLPEGVSEKNLAVAFRNKQAGTWTKLTSTVDPEANTVTAGVNHFTEFAILASTRPASFVASDLSISPEVISMEEEVSISVRISNAGDLTGSYDINLKLDNIVMEKKEVTLAGGDSQTVDFSLKGYIKGTHTVSIGTLSGTFEVKKPPSPPHFVVSDLVVAPAEVSRGEDVTIGVTVSNEGGLAGSHQVTLRVDGIADKTKEIAVPGGGSEMVHFMVTGDTAGSHVVSIADLSGSFLVREKVSVSAVVENNEVEGNTLPADLPPAQPVPQPERQQVKPIVWVAAGCAVIGLICGVAIPIYLLIRKRNNKKKS